MATENPSVKEASVIVVMVPFPVHSHMNQLLQLSCLISSYKIPVHYAGSSIHNSQVRTRAHALNLSEIQFHDFPIPPFVPDPTTNSTEFLLPYFHVTEHLRQLVGALVHQLSSKAKRIIIIHDALTSSAVQDATSIINAETYVFQATTVFTIFGISCAVSSEKFLPIPSELAENINDPIEIPSIEGTFSYETINFMTRQSQFMKLSALGHLYNACRVIDGAFLDLLVEKQNDKKVWPVGPLHLQVTYSKNNGGNSINGRDKCLEWFDKQEQNSVLYISFGTTISMGDHNQQLKELALGLELSETKFIWVFTDADHKNDGFGESEKGRQHELPEGFEERVKGKGMVVRNWAPQLEILEHKSTGGFLSHCGWNSCLESISYGVPIATWPMHSDQPMNALLITEVLKIGVNVKEWARRDQVVSSSEISKALRRLMGSDEGDEMRKRAKDLGDKVRSATADGGVSQSECDSFISHITR